MNPQTWNAETVTLTTVTTVNYLVVCGDVIVYRIVAKTIPASKPENTTETVTEGITSVAGMTTFQAGSDTMPRYSKKWSGIMGTPEFREMARVEGWGSDAFYKTLEGLTQKPYTRFIEGTASAQDIVFLESSCNRLYDVEGALLPVAVECSYMDGGYDNAHYNLDKALEILRQRDDIRFKAESPWQKSGEVNRILGYNAGDGRTDCIRFVWTPSAEEYRRMGDKCTEIGGTYPSTNRYQAIFDLDMFGLRAGGAAKFSDFYGCEEPEDDTSDDTSDDDEDGE